MLKLNLLIFVIQNLIFNKAKLKIKNYNFLGVAPSYAIKKLLERTGFKISDIDYFEINEAFSVAALAN